MAEKDGLIVRILREIQATQAEHGRVLADHTESFRDIKDTLAAIACAWTITPRCSKR